MSAWTEYRVTRLKQLWPQGHSATWIAAELGGGLTRNAVLAKVWRLNLSKGRAAPKARKGPVPAATLALPREGASTAPPEIGGASILSVRRTDCRWPYGDPSRPDFSLCGCRVMRGAYCAPHAAVAYRGVPQSVEGLMEWAGVR